MLIHTARGRTRSNSSVSSFALLRVACTAIVAAALALPATASAAACNGTFLRSDVTATTAGRTIWDIASDGGSGAWIVGDDPRGRSLAARGTAGGGWRRTSTPNPRGAASTRLLGVSALSPTNAWMVGNAFYGTGFLDSYSLPVVARWNGRTTTRVAAPPQMRANDELHDVAVVGPRNVWVVGSRSGRAYSAQWDGVRWNPRPVPNLGGQVSALSKVRRAGDGTVWAIGSTTTQGVGFDFRTTTELLRYTAGRWRRVAHPALGAPATLTGIAVTPDSSQVFVAAKGYPAADQPRGYVLAGARPFSTFTTELPVDAITSITDADATAAGGVWVSGSTYGTEAPEQPFVLRRDGATWTRVDLSLPAADHVTTSTEALDVGRDGSVWVATYDYRTHSSGVHSCG